MEIPVRMNTTRPVSLCSLWGEGGVIQGLGGPPWCPGWRHKPDSTTDAGRREVEGSPNSHLAGSGPYLGVKNRWRGRGRALQYGGPRPLHWYKLIVAFFFF